MSAARGPALRVVRRAAPAAAYALVFALSAVLGLVLHLNTSAGRRLVARETGALVSSLLVAGLRIERIEVLSPTRLAVSRATLLDRLNQPVLRAEGLDVRFGLLELLRGILGERELRVALPEVRAQHVAVWLMRDPENGGLTFETAFDTRAPKSPGPPAKPIVVVLPRIEVESASVATNLTGIEHVTARVSKLAARLEVSPAGVVLALKSGDARVMKLLARDATGRLDAELRFPGATRAELTGQVGRVPITARAGLRGAELDLSASSDGMAPEAMRELFPAWPLLVPLQARAGAKGPLGAMQAQVEGRAGDARIRGSGTLALDPEVVSDLGIHVEDLDLRVLEASAPATALDVDAKLRLARGPNGFDFSASGTLPESKLGSLVVPPLRAKVDYARHKLTGTVEVAEPGLETEVRFELLPEGKLAFGARSKSIDLAALGRYGVTAEGRATARVQGSIQRGELSAELDTTLSGPRSGAVSAESVVVHAGVRGPANEPERLTLAVAATGKELDAGGIKLSSFRATADGTANRQDWLVEGTAPDGGTFEASAAVAPRAGPLLTGVRVASRQGGAEAVVTAERVALDPVGISVEELSFDAGKGGVRGSIAVRGARRIIDLTISDLDLAKALAAFGLASRKVSGRLDGRIQIEEQGVERTGHARIELRDGAVPPLEGLTARAEADFAGAEVKAHATLAVREMVGATLDASGALRRSVLDPQAPGDLTGVATLAFSDLALERFGKTFLAAAGIGLAGHAEGKLSVARPDAQGSPRFSYELATHELVIARGKEPTSGLRLDVDSAGELFAPEGSRVALELVDTQGPWVTLRLEHSLDGRAFGRSSLKELAQALLDAPVKARITAYRRPLRMLGVAGTQALEGTVAGAIDVTGTPRTPEIDASLDVHAAPLGPAAEKPELAIQLRYSAAREEYAIEAHTKGEPRVVEFAGSGRFGWFSHGFGKNWSAAGEAKITHLDLERVARAIDVPLDGDLAATLWFDVDRGHLDAKGEVKLTSVTVDGRRLGSGSGHLVVADGRGEATLRVAEGPKMIELLTQAGLTWGEDGLRVDRKRPGMLRATVQDLEVASLGSLVRGSVRRLGGRLSGRAEVDWGVARNNGGGTTLRANATLRDGTASLVAGGGLIRDIDAQALADGTGPLRLTFSGAARSRKPNIKGTADLRLDGPRFKRLDAKFELDGFPLLYDGILMGRATTGAAAPKLAVTIVAHEKGQTVDVSIPAVEVKLPESSDKKLIALDDDPVIEIRDAALDPEEERQSVRSDGRTTLKVRLGQKVVIKRDALEVPVGADLTVLADGRLDGSVTLRPGGVVPALGQTFRITRGVITFKNEEPKDGTLAIDASTRAADGTLIELAITGKVKEPEVAFRSDPPRSKNEIVALLLGIQSDSTKTSDGGQLGRTAMALAMNRLVEGSALSGLQFGAGETPEGEAVSSVSMRVASKVWVEGRTVKGSTTSVNPDERVSGVVDWRFAPSWSLRTQLGGISGVEIRWSLRY